MIEPMRAVISVRCVGVKAMKNFHGESLTVIDFVEHMNPFNWMAPHMVEDGTDQTARVIALQIQKGIQQAFGSGIPEMLRLTLVLTMEELEAFGIEPYPNEIYNLCFENGVLRFEKTRQELMK